MRSCVPGIWCFGTGVDYFSTLGYQPGIALLAAGAFSISATGALVAVTLFGAVPIYAEVACRSYAGQGSIALLENLFFSWKSKSFMLVLLVFAATDFVITMTLSAADAARHALANPYLHSYVGNGQIILIQRLLLVLAVLFLSGFPRIFLMSESCSYTKLVLLAVVILPRLRTV